MLRVASPIASRTSATVSSAIVDPAVGGRYTALAMLHSPSYSLPARVLFSPVFPMGAVPMTYCPSVPHAFHGRERRSLALVPQPYQLGGDGDLRLWIAQTASE